MKNKKVLLSVLMIIILALAGCGGDDGTQQEEEPNYDTFDTYEESVSAKIADDSGESDINLEESIVCTYTEGDYVYDLAYSKNAKSGTDDMYYYLLVTTTNDEGDKYYTQRLSEDQSLQGDLSIDNPYVGFTVQNNRGTVYMSVVKVFNDDYIVKFEGKVCQSPSENIYVQAADYDPDLKITKANGDEVED